MAVTIRLARGGRKKAPFYSIVATDSRMPRNGRFLEKLGYYNPISKELSINLDRYKYWKSVGAQESEAVEVLYKKKSESK